VFGELLNWGFIASLYIAAFGILRLEKHWHRTAEVLFTLATLSALCRLMLWAWNNPDGLNGGVAFVVTICAIASMVWFVQKVEGDISQKEAQEVEAPSSRSAATNRALQHSSFTEYTPHRTTTGQVIDQRARRLTNNQTKQLIATLKQEKYPPVLCLRYRNTDMEACQFVNDFREVFKEGGWTKIDNQYEYVHDDTRRGLFVETKWNHLPPTGAYTLANGLKAIGLTVTLKTSRSVRREDDVVLFIGAIED
jgi:hypothetical protein